MSRSEAGIDVLDFPKAGDDDAQGKVKRMGNGEFAAVVVRVAAAEKDG